MGRKISRKAWPSNNEINNCFSLLRRQILHLRFCFVILKSFTLTFLFQVAVLKMPVQNVTHQQWVSFLVFYQMTNEVSCGFCHKNYEICNFIRPAKLEQICEESWSDIRKQLRESTGATLVNKTLSHNILNIHIVKLHPQLLFNEMTYSPSHRWALRRSVPSSSPEQQLLRRRC